MEATRHDPADEVPEADLLDQRTPLDPATEDGPDSDLPVVGEPLPDVDDADLLEQLSVVPDGDEDDHPRDTSVPD